MSTTTNEMNVQNSEVRPVVVKPVDSKTLEGSYPGDHRSQAAGNTSALRGNDTPVRGETTNDENAGA